MSDDILTGIAMAVAVVAIEQLVVFMVRRQRRRKARNWEHVVQAHHLIDTTPKPRGRKWL